MLFPQLLLVRLVADGQRQRPVVVEQVADHAGHPGRVEHVHGGAVVGRGDAHGGVLA